MKRLDRLRRLAVAGALLAGAGCLRLSKDFPDTRRYAFEVRREASPAPAGAGAVLEVRGFRDTPRSEGMPLLYRLDASRYESDFYHRFFAPPASLITEDARDWLGRAGIFGAVVGPGADPEPAFVLDATVSALYGDFRASPARAVLGIQVFVLRTGSGDPALALHRDYEASEEAGRGDPDALLSGWNAGLRTILERLESDLRGLLASPAGP